MEFYYPFIVLKTSNQLKMKNGENTTESVPTTESIAPVIPHHQTNELQGRSALQMEDHLKDLSISDEYQSKFSL